ncbi:pimeloyl-ACP methyl ester carboxylesterase [Spinactinospora alkalitolerans]|uniref:Pimeloyl-ACP methyl ester carboxylesterase n=1 Tax=Spinactinospora alkalitolerans TaxID=687207 RepID=A0A852TWC5_9ACTN|nr:alpha/beta hydrolase [Spinactinospora alkalitolerans]NYE47153.1 pimeloyl-ACP methyl ester carboxylesterase [Spinactinospora alkalitolerans]
MPQQTIDGTRIAYQTMGAPGGPTTVGLHGGGPGCHAAADLAGIIARLPERRWLLVDLPGYGRSDTLPAHCSVFRGRARLLGGLLDALELNEADIVAPSLGGSVALALAAERPAAVRRITLIGSQPIPAPSGTRADFELGARARDRYYGGTGPSTQKMRRLLADLEWYEASAIPEENVRARYEASVTPTALAAAGVAPEDLTDEVSRVCAPTLVLWGRHDPFADAVYADALAAGLPRGDLVVLGRSAHHPQAERPTETAGLVSAFLSGP